ncbi:hypothetical protein ACIQBJ_11330 [Kitasatospora sp. NPDC088391]|uniref:hypothetical protein n=1 Tax=Kitasatospora sp. NPDC088391 TaxID=3364074 RepID=UPI003802B0D7
MNGFDGTHEPLLRRLPVQSLYPRAYRAAHGAEIADVLAESLRDADGRTALREYARLAAHALRLRLRIGSGDPAGRALAGAAPFLLAGGAALGAVHLLTGVVLRGSRAGLAEAALIGAQSAPWALALLGAVLGRWGWARALVLAAVAAAPLGPDVLPGPSGELLGLWALMGGLVLLAPPDGVDLAARTRSRAVGSAIALALPMSAVAVVWIGHWPTDHTATAFPTALRIALDAFALWPAVVTAVVVGWQLADPDTDRVQAGGAALAALPWTVMVAPPLYDSVPVDHHDLLRGGALTAVLVLAAAVLGVLRRAARPARPRG